VSPPTRAAIERPSLIELVTRMQMERLRSLAAALSRDEVAKGFDLRVEQLEVRCRSTPSLQKEAAWRVVTASKKFEA
jgi:hypothetical protein